jgi:stage V sporulation protein K
MEGLEQMSKHGKRRNIFKIIETLEESDGFSIVMTAPRQKLSNEVVQDWSDECVTFFEDIRFSRFLIPEDRSDELFDRLTELARLLTRVANFHDGIGDGRNRSIDGILAEVHWHLLGPNCNIELADHHFRRSGMNPDLIEMANFEEDIFVSKMMVAERYFDGVGVNKDTDAARELFDEATEDEELNGKDLSDEGIRLLARLGCEAIDKLRDAFVLLNNLWTHGGYIAAQGTFSFLSETLGEDAIGDTDEEPDPVSRKRSKLEHSEVESEESKEVQLNAALEDLNSKIGLGSVKAKVLRMVSQEKVRALRRAQGWGESSVAASRHMVLTGNPGTGKTTVARVLAKLFYLMGVLENDLFIETDRQGLVAGYTGQTAIKTTKVIESALGGVLFIDEAYSLQAEQDNFGAEAINTLLKAMEDHRSELIVIVAGYTKEMDKFLESNPGLRSRFNTTLDFEDYSPAEMLDILVEMSRKADFVIDNESKSLAALAFQRAYGTKVAASNGRFVRNLFESLEEHHAHRVYRLSESVLKNDRSVLRTFTTMDLTNAAVQLGLDLTDMEPVNSSCEEADSDDSFRGLKPIYLKGYAMGDFI